MKEATGELNMTVVTVIAIAAIGVFLMAFLPQIINGIKSTWASGTDCKVGQHPVYDDSTGKYNCVAD